MKKLFTFLACLYSYAVFAQAVADSSKTLDSVTVKVFEQRTPAPVTTLCCSVPVRVAEFSSKLSLVNGLNSVAGVRMEERSPGSYRINIRGSSLRSPFGVRNIKVYWNNIPVTDPGGNTYFNQFAWNNFSDIYIYKGPAGSLYGSGTGGLIYLSSTEGPWVQGMTAEYTAGTYNLHNFFASAKFGKRENKNIFTYAHNQTDGYRVQSNMRRDNFSWVSQVDRIMYQLTTSILFTDMYYQTPGALTLNEYNNNPKAARPAGGGFPSAVNAKAAIYQKNFLSGISALFHLALRFSNTTTLYGAFAQVKNPAIRNYERRIEPSFGVRSIFKYYLLPFSKYRHPVSIDIIAGTEIQKGYFNIQVSNNKNGNPDTLQTNDDINNSTISYFSQLTTSVDYKWFITTGISINKTKIEIIRRNYYPVVPQARTYKNEVMPRFTVMRRIKAFSILVSAAKGYSPPTTAEVLPSTGVISTTLEAENGWNYEATIKAELLRKKLNVELTGFHFNLHNALVQRRDAGGADYFINAGNTVQRGLEFACDLNRKIPGPVFDYFTFRTDLSVNSFRYGSFIKGTEDFSGKKLPSVPASVISLLGDIYLENGLYLRGSYYGSSSIYLNDANTARAEPYHLLGSQLGWKKKKQGRYELNMYIGADNLLNEKYSLGNDINAATGRFYNAAPRRNFYAGISFQWIKPPAK